MTMNGRVPLVASLAGHDRRSPNSTMALERRAQKPHMRPATSVATLASHSAAHKMGTPWKGQVGQPLALMRLRAPQT